VGGDTEVEVKAGLEADLLANGVDPADIWATTPPNMLYLFPDDHAFLKHTNYEQVR